MPRRILVVSRDLSSGRVILPIAKVARDAGDEVHVVVEGLASKAFVEAGFVPDFMGTVDHRDAPFQLDVPALLRKLAPGVVLTGQSVPIFLEREVMTGANKMGIPTATGEDTWGGSLRMTPPTKPDLFLVVDDYSAGLARPQHSSARFEVFGHIGRPTPEEMGLYGKQLPEIVELRTRYDKVILYIGGGARTTAEIELLKKCLRTTPGNWCLIARFHPKWKDRVVSPGPKDLHTTYEDIWNGMLREVGDRYIGTLPSVKKTECLTGNADIVVGSFTNLTIAGRMGKVPITFETEQGTAELLTPYGLKETPHVAIGLAHGVSVATDLNEFAPISPEVLAKIQPYDPEAAYRAVVSLVG